MKTIKTESSAETESYVDEIAQTLERGGVVCMPCGGRYRLLADLYDADAVLSLMQAKRRVSKAPSLVFIADDSMLDLVADPVDESAKKLMKELWPGALTIRFKASDEIPRKVRKIVTKATGKIGVRVPEEALLRLVVKRLGRPVLVSSANRENKSGETSPAKIRQTFFGRIALFVDAGDLAKTHGSTVVDIKKGKVKIIRAGHVPEDKINAVLGG